jgi:integrase
MAKFGFNLKSQKSNDPVPIYLIIRSNYQKIKFGIGESISPKDWNTEKQRVKESRSFAEFPEFNAYLDSIISSAKTIWRTYLIDNDNREPSFNEMRELLKVKFRGADKKSNNNINFYDFVEMHIEDTKTKVNTDTGRMYSPYTIIMYKQTLRRIREFSIQKNYAVDFESIDLVFYDQFMEFLSRDLNMAKNSAGRHIKTLKAWLSEATERGFNKNLTFKSKRFKKTIEISEAVYLNLQELDEIEKLDLSHNPKLDRVRDLLIVGCYTGLRFFDLCSLKRENIKENTIEVITAKTSERVIIPIHKSVRKVLQKYEGIYVNGLPPKMSNTNLNRYIKEFCQLVDCLHCEIQLGITKGGIYTKTTYKKYELICSHTCRRSFATNTYRMGVSPLTVMKITGHKSSRVFENYVKLSVDQHADMLQDEWSKRGLL